MSTELKTKSQETAADIAALLRARNSVLWIVSREEARVEKYSIEAAGAAGYISRTWDVAQGVADISGKLQSIGSPDPGATLDAIRDRAASASNKERCVWIMRDLPVWLSGPAGATQQRQLRNLARSLPGVARDNAQAIIVISPSGDVPAELAGHTTVIEWPLPDRAEIAAILDAAIDALPEEIKAQAAPNGTRDAAIDASVGLSGEEAAACFARSLVQLRKIDPSTINREKKRIIAKERVLEWLDPLPGGLDAVGGLDNLKTWSLARRLAYTPAARAYGLPAPKGVMLVGVPGCGKTMFAKAIASAFGNSPLLRFDPGALKSKYVGESEGLIRKSFKVIEAIGPCVVLFDEVEKGLQGATSGSADGGVSADALGALLSWMQDRTCEAFIVMTANNIAALPPELLRKGRIDEVWFVDLPNDIERASVMSASLRSHGRGKVEVDLAAISAATKGFTGSEIAELVPDALFTAFADGAREINTDDLLQAASTVTPLSKTANEKIEGLRNWATGRARSATSAETTQPQAKNTARVLDL